MKNRKDISDIELDELFKKASQSVKAEFEEKSWENLESKLNDSEFDTKGIFFNSRNLLIIVAILFFMGVVGTKYFGENNSFINSSKEKLSEATNQNQEPNRSIDLNTSEEVTKNIDTHDNQIEPELNFLKNQKGNVSDNNHAHTNHSILSSEISKSEDLKKIAVLEKSIINKNIDSKQKANVNPRRSNEGNDSYFETHARPISQPSDELMSNSINNRLVEITSLQRLTKKGYTHNDIAKAFNQEPSQFHRKSDIIPIELKQNKDHKIYLTVGLSPDFSKVIENSFIKMGHNWSAQLEYHLDKRWSIHSGLIFSEKFYGSKVDGMHWPDNWGAMPKEMMGMEGSCNVLDLPLNLRYNIKYDDKAKMYLLGGFSSFIMLNEKYDYLYPENFPMDGMKTNWTSEKNGFLAAGMANFAIGYERKIGNVFSMQIEPFVKIPIRDFGFSQVKLASTGVFLTGKIRLK